MLKNKRLGFFLSFGLVFVIMILLYINNTSEAAEVILPQDYYFVYNGQNKAAGSEIEMKTQEAVLYVTSGKWEPSTTVEWITSEPGVLALENTSYGSNFKKLVRKGPGYSQLTAIIKQGSNSYSVSCLIKVGLEFDYQKTGMTTVTTTNEKILILDNINDSKNIFLKFVDYVTDDSQAVSGSAISVNAVTWESDNEGVVKVDNKGKITAVGGGSALIKVTTNTMSTQNKTLQISLRAVVRPTFSATYDDIYGEHHVVNSVDNVNLVNPALNVPTNFVLESNATLAENLTWEVYDFSTGKKLPTEGAKLSYTVSPISGNVSFRNVKAGTYEVFAFVNNKYNVNTKAPYAYMKVVVPIVMGEQNIVMTVGDSYNLAEDSNIPGVNIFEYYYEIGNQSIASIDQTTGIVKANSKGKIRLRLDYKESENLYDHASGAINDIYINITVIDGIALNTTSATLFTSGTILLQAIVTDATQPVTWSSSAPTIASVDKGLVKGLKAGTTIITAQQKINGVVKKATCVITIQQSVSTIEIDPSTVVLPIGSYKTLHAYITPNNLIGVKLQWKSSNDSIVSVVESDALTATIKAEAGGTAVISAINQENVVVGYCHVIVEQKVTSMVLSETEATVDLNTKRLQLRATVYPENAINQKVNWSVSDPATAKVDQNGLVTLLKPGSVTIIATSDDDPKITAMCRLTIQIPVLSIALDEAEKTMYVGQTARLSYLIMPINASNNSVTWTTTNNSVVQVDSTGKVTAKGVGTAVIILKTLDGGLTSYCTISVRRVATGVSLSATELKMRSGEKFALEATFTPKDSTDTALAWESSDTKVAVVDDKGRVTAKDAGKAIIMVRTEAGGTAYCTVTVTKPVEGLLLNFTEKTIYVGDEFELKVSINPSDATKMDVTWKSSNPKVATINEDGIVEGLSGGTTLITVTTADKGYSAICAVTVRELVTTIKIDPESYRLGLDKTVILTATVTNQTATNHKVTWRSSNEKVATVTQKGKVTAISYGFATITAVSLDGSDVEAECEIEVVKPVTRISLSDAYLPMLVGEGKELKATLEPKSATYNRLSWSSSNDNIAVVDEDGFVTALAPGNAMITVEAQDDSKKKAICYITVSDRLQAKSITLSDKKLVMISGDTKTVGVALNPVNSTDKYSWSSDNSSVAKVDKKTGKITALSAGTATVTVMTDSGVKASLEITVIGLNVTKLELEQYERFRLEVEGATTTIKWSTSNPNVVTVTNGNLITYATGTAEITATVNGKKLKCTVTVVKIK